MQALKACERACATGSTASPDATLFSRMRFIRKRLQEVEAGELPDASMYLDSAGPEVRATHSGAEGAGRSQMYEDEPGVERYAPDEDEAVQEAARKEWLEYYHRVGDWKRASDLIVDEGEYDDLVYLIDHERRAAREQGLEWDEAAATPYGVGSDGGFQAFLRTRGVAAAE
jgi:hypothetical protein